MTLPLEIYLICFAAASVIHAAQAVLAAKLMWHRTGSDRVEAREGVTLGVTTFFWQFGNLATVLAISLGFDGTTVLFRVSSFIREGSLVCFPLLFSYLSVCYPPALRKEKALRLFGGYLRYALWPWTLVCLISLAAANVGFKVPVFSPGIAVSATLHIMLLYFVLFTVTVAKYRRKAEDTKVASLIRAQKAGVIAGVLSVGTFVLMLSGYWRWQVPLFSYIELTAMLTSVPFVIAIAYRQYQFPFMDAFIREVISGVLLLVAFVAAISVSKHLLWMTACAVVLAYCKAPLTRWVERTFIGYEEPVEEQEQRIGSAIRGLTQFDEFPARVSEILGNELQSQWTEITSTPRTDAVHHFEIPGSGLCLSIGLRVGGQYMSRHLRIARTAALQLAAHHHQLRQHELRDATARAQMRALQAQINPHFLFNTLNVLASLIHSDPSKAERVTEELADIFRYALESTRAEWVNLDDEMRFIESYLAIEKARFQERLVYSLDVAPEVRSLKIPPMIVQPLVENAIKHGVGPKVEGGEIRLQARLAGADSVVIVVEDTGGGHLSTSRNRGTGIGLSNVRQRLHHVYGDAGALKLETISSGGTRAVLSFPQPVGVRP
jgi:signal transduction histidine kinase